MLWGRGREKVIGTFPTMTLEAARASAQRTLVEIAEHGGPAKRSASIKLAGFIDEHFAPWALAHQKAGQATVDALRATFADLLDRPLSSLAALDVERVRAERLAKGRKPATVNRDLDRIRGALSRAVEWGFIAEHPLKAVRRARGADNSRVRYLSQKEEKRLRDALVKREGHRRTARASGNAWAEERGRDQRPTWPKGAYTDHLMPMVLVAINTGLRRGELFGLDWAQVDLAAKRLTVTAGNAKSRKARHVPLNKEALAVLKQWRKQGTGKGLVFPSPSGGRFDNINKAWAGLVTDAELTDFRFHDLRHHFASRLVQAGVDLYTVKELLGHADFAMTQRYAHLAPGHLAAAVEKLVG